MALQVDWLHILLVLCLLELCVLHCFKVPSILFAWHLFVFGQNWNTCHLEGLLRPHSFVFLFLKSFLYVLFVQEESFHFFL
jgi:hypothetical protein